MTTTSRRAPARVAITLALLATATVVRSVSTTDSVSAAVSPSLLPLSPARLLDTRSGPDDKTVDGSFRGAGALLTGGTLALQVTGRGGVPDGATAAMLNLTVAAPHAPGFLTVHPCAAKRPLTSNVNYVAGEIVANAALVKLDGEGTVCIYASATTHVVVDVNGYAPQGSSLGTLTPARLLDTRSGPDDKTVDGAFQGTGKVASLGTLELQVTGRGKVPQGTAAAMLNVTAAEPQTFGHLTVFPCGGFPPLASHLNYHGPDANGSPSSNAVLAKLDSSGKVCIFTYAATHLVVDVTAYVPTESSLWTLDPARLVETRDGATTYDFEYQGDGRVTGGTAKRFLVAGRGDVSPGAVAAMLNVTAVAPEAPGFLTVYPCNEQRPHSSNVNYPPHLAVPNAVLAKLDPDGYICIFASATTDLVVDVNGYVGSDPPPSVVGPRPPSSTTPPTLPPATVPPTTAPPASDPWPAPERVSAGWDHSCGVRLYDQDQPACWGSNDSGQARNSANGPLWQVSSGDHHSCGVLGGQVGQVWCWGDNTDGQIAAPAGNFVHVSAGAWHSCGVRASRSMTCWGDNTFGQRTAPTGRFVQAAAGDMHTCGLRTNSSVICWGDNTDGQANPPAGAFRQISAGGRHSCGVRTNGTLACWGDNTDGQANPPAGVFAAVSAGYQHTCALSTDGSLRCWGENLSGQASPPSGKFIYVAAGVWHSCGARVDGVVVCWGDDEFGQSSPPSRVFTQVSTGVWHSCGVVNAAITCSGDNEYGQSTPPTGQFSKVAAGHAHTCGLRADQTVTCWGTDEFGDTVAPSGPFFDITVGAAHSCGLRIDWSIACWGDNEYGQIDAPTGTFRVIDAGYWHTCALGFDNRLACWGDNEHGQTGAPTGPFRGVSAGGLQSCAIRNSDIEVECWGTNGSGHAPSPPGNPKFLSVSAGTWHACGIELSHRDIICWGNDGFGQSTPPRGAHSDVSAGAGITCALRPDTVATCWGIYAVLGPEMVVGP